MSRAAVRLRGFFYTQALLHTKWAQELTRDELVLYLLHCRGYDPKKAGSLFGAKGARIRGGMSFKPFLDAQANLEALGLIRLTGTFSRPITHIADLRRPLAKSRPALDIASPDTADQHKYEWLSKEDDLILMPWRLVDGDRYRPEARLLALQAKEAVMLLLWCYHNAESDGYLASDRVWLPALGEMHIAFSERAAADLGFDVAELQAAGTELLKSGLVVPTCADAHGRVVLHLYHPLDVPDTADVEGKEPDSDLVQEEGKKNYEPPISYTERENQEGPTWNECRSN